MKATKLQAFRLLLIMWIIRLNLITYKGKKMEYLNYAKAAQMESGKKPILLFELGALQVYHFQTEEQIAAEKKYTDVYWRDKNSQQTVGPFPTIYDAVAHWTWHLSQLSENAAENVIHVDFYGKRRIKK